MARRTIRARRASPYLLYLLIAFVVISVTFAVLFAVTYSRLGSVNEKVFGLQGLAEARAREGADLWRDFFADHPGIKVQEYGIAGLLTQKGREAEEYGHEIHRLLNSLVGDPYPDQKGDDLRKTVTGALNQSSDVLYRTIEVLQKSYPAIPDVPEKVDIPLTSMTAAIRALSERIGAMQAQITTERSHIQDLQVKIKGLTDENAAQKDINKREVEQLKADIADEKRRLTDARDRAQAQTVEFKEKLDRALDRMLVVQREKQAEVDKVKLVLDKRQQELTDMAGEIDKYRQVPTETGVDGRIVRVSDIPGVAYADLGEKDGVLLGMNFAVFSARVLGQTDAQPKAEARVIRVMQDSSELRIYDAKQPVIAGDALVNAVYDRTRRLSFRLVGKMDMDGDGIDDTERLKAQIQRFGGRIDDALSVRTDYLVLGEEPELPAPPREDDPPMIRTRYEEARRAFLEYSEAKARAESFKIPILSLNRFMGLIGMAGRM